MSALRKDSQPAPAPPSALAEVKRFVSPEQYAKLETIITLRELPTGPADWSIVADSTGLPGTARYPLAGLQPYLWLLVAVLHVAENKTWTEITAHPWILGGIAPATIRNKRGEAKLAIGISLDQFIADYRSAYERAYREILAYHREQDAADALRILRKGLNLSEVLIDDCIEDRDEARRLRESFKFREPGEAPQAEDGPQQAPLELLDSDGNPMEPRDAAREDARALRLSRRVGYSDSLTKALQRAILSAESAAKAVRLIHGQSTENVAEVEADAAAGVLNGDPEKLADEVERERQRAEDLRHRRELLAAEEAADNDSGEGA